MTCNFFSEQNIVLKRYLTTTTMIQWSVPDKERCSKMGIMITTCLMLASDKRQKPKEQTISITDHQHTMKFTMYIIFSVRK